MILNTGNITGIEFVSGIPSTNYAAITPGQWRGLTEDFPSNWLIKVVPLKNLGDSVVPLYHEAKLGPLCQTGVLIVPALINYRETQLPGVMFLIGNRRSIVRLCLDASADFRGVVQYGEKIFPESVQAGVSVPWNWLVVSELPVCILASDSQQLAV